MRRDGLGASARLHGVTCLQEPWRCPRCSGVLWRVGHARRGSSPWALRSWSPRLLLPLFPTLASLPNLHFLLHAPSEPCFTEKWGQPEENVHATHHPSLGAPSPSPVPPVLPLLCQPALISCKYLHGTFPHVFQVLVQMSPSQGLFPDHPLQTLPRTIACFVSITPADIVYVFLVHVVIGRLPCPSLPHVGRKAL